MVTKNEILNEFKKNPEKFWKVKIFDQEGFKRRVCKICGKGFWSIKELEICPEHKPYEFIERKVTKSLDYVETWELFKKFFEQNGHEVISRYPVISRWHPQLFFTIASIQDFQRIEAGKLFFEYPANPLIVPQICLRFNDVENVGVSGRHLTSFQMSGQHSFNDGNPKAYWKDECIRLNFEFLTSVLKIPKEEIVYVEDLWAMPDFSAFGSSIEAYALGLELVNNVFMEFSYRNKIVPLEMKVVDVGWGHDRLVWFTQGVPTVYDAIFPLTLKNFLQKVGIEKDKELLKTYFTNASKLDVENVLDLKEAQTNLIKELSIDEKEFEAKIFPFEVAYAVCDHVRTLCFAVADGALPSNTGAGFFLRTVLRRAWNLMEKVGMEIELEKVAEWLALEFHKIFPELKEYLNDIQTILNVEKRKFEESKKRIGKIIESWVGKEVNEAEAKKLYQTHGISPLVLKEYGVKVKVPKDFLERISQKKFKVEKEKFEVDLSEIPATKILYYEEPEIYEFKAKVLKMFENWVVLDQTAFFPLQGGQAWDEGYIGNSKVLEVRKVGNVILHKVDSINFEEKEEVECKIDRERRNLLKLNHDAIHLINGATRKILGNWVNQHGSEVGIEKSRLDITHFENLNEEQIERIEKLANQIIKKNVRIKKFWMERSEAEKTYGFRIYQGGYVPSKKVRIVEIEGFDVEACSGTHGSTTKDIKLVKILKTKKIADDTIRIEIVAGEKALEYLKQREKLLKEIAEKLGVEEREVPKRVEEIFKEWKSLRKRLKNARRTV